MTMWLPEKPPVRPRLRVAPPPRVVVYHEPKQAPTICYTVPDYRGGRVTIPMCWSAVLYGDDACDCPGTPGGIAADRHWRAIERLYRMRERRRRLDLAAEGVAAMPGARLFRTEVVAPIRLRNLRVVPADGR